MPNTITITAAKANTVKSIEYLHPNTSVWQDSNVLTGVTPGTYTNIMCRLKNSNPAITAAWAQAVIVAGQQVATVPGQITTFNPQGGESEILTTWAAPASNGGSPITGYQLRYRVAGATVWVLLPVVTTLYADVAGLSDDTTYELQVAAINAIGTGAYSIIKTATTVTGAVTLAAPTGTAEPGSEGVLQLTSTTIANATGYRLFRSPTLNGTYVGIGGTLATPSYTNSGLASGTTYFYKWQVVGNGTTYLTSPQGAVFSGTTIASIPRGIAPTNVSVDDDLNFLSFTPAYDEPNLAEYEYFVGDENSPLQVTTNPIGLGNIAVAAGSAGFRRKAKGPLAASLWQYTQAPFRLDYAPPQPAQLTGWVSAERRYDLRYDEPTTLAAAAETGSQVLQVVSAATLQQHSALRLNGEACYVDSVAGTTVTLLAPLKAAYEMGTVVERAFVEQLRDISNTSGTEVYAAFFTYDTCPRYLRNPATGEAWLQFNGVDTRFAFGEPLGASYSEFILVDVDPTGTVSYITAGSGNGEYPGLIANAVPGRIEWRTTVNPAFVIKDGVAGPCVIGLTSTVGGTNRFFYADSNTPPVKVGEQASSANAQDVGAKHVSFGAIATPGYATKMKLKEFSCYRQYALSEAEAMDWMQELYNRHIAQAGPVAEQTYTAPDYTAPGYTA